MPAIQLHDLPAHLLSRVAYHLDAPCLASLSQCRRSFVRAAEDGARRALRYSGFAARPGETCFEAYGVACRVADGAPLAPFAAWLLFGGAPPPREYAPEPEAVRAAVGRWNAISARRAATLPRLAAAMRRCAAPESGLWRPS